MSCYAVKKSTFLTLLLLSVSVASAEEAPRQLRGPSDPTQVDDKRGSKQDLVGFPAHDPHESSTSSRTRSNRLPHSARQNKHHTMKGPGRLQAAAPFSRAGTKHAQGSNPEVKRQMMKGGALKSRRHVTPRARQKVNRERSHTRRNAARNGHPLNAEKKLQSGGHPRGSHGPSHPMHGAMGRSNGHQSRHGANNETQGSHQHVRRPHLPVVGDQNATRSTQGTRSFDSRIVGGFTAGVGEYKFIATLYFGSSADSSSFGCGGSLIAPDMVLTAAHCGGESVSSVRIGSNSLESGGELRDVASQCVHPNYDSMQTLNDYMIVKLDSPVDTSEYPIIELNQDASLPLEDDMLTVIGYGLTTDGGDVSQTLQKVEVPMNSYQLCNQQYGGTIVEDIQFCAGFVEGGKDSCQGDSGGPIFEMRGTTPVQVGVVSFGEGCAQPDRSGVYARVTGAYEWIQATMANLDAGDTSGCSGGTRPGTDDNSFSLNDDASSDDGDWSSGGDDGSWGSGGDDGGWGSGGHDGGSGGDDDSWGSGDDGWWYYDDDGGWYSGR